MEPLGSLLRLAAEMSNETQVRVDSGLKPRRFKVREMRHGDLPAVAAIHHENLPHGLFPQLGRGFLRAYLATFLDSPHAVGFVAVTHGPPVGFLVGTFEDRHHYRYVLRHHWASSRYEVLMHWRYVHAWPAASPGQGSSVTLAELCASPVERPLLSRTRLATTAW